ncbi:hypothetical protein [Quadrisphaera sp. DSM 44207]|uniref:hypothetical protein n=1 Tax=Quadrisphaera sp. DSM 44207 TaxID=1881057 RepID=UPI00088F2356|nr:hypothetical protein [Quadrisphaera sp. DSM 44207]SDQ10198.1 hypothetical protein SAMN05428996_0533 [Quadrisphaera sp. DSM 44207]
MTGTGALTDAAARHARDGRDGRHVPERHARRTRGGALWWTALSVVLAAHAAPAVHDLLTARLWFDEAYNLTVPVNLAAGRGYASDGNLTTAFTTGALDPFDVRISTGPVVLLPIAALVAAGVDPVLAGRGVVAAHYALLLAALLALGRRLAGRWVALGVVTAPLLLRTADVEDPVLSPVEVVGEVPAAAWTVLALLALHRGPALAGLCLGLAIQCKLVVLLAGPAFLLAAAWAVSGPPRARLAAAGRLFAAAAAPTVLVELVQLASLGPGGYARRTRDLLAFLGEDYEPVPASDKLDLLLDVWSLPPGAVVAALLLLLAAPAAVLLWRARRPAPGWAASPARQAELLAAALTSATWLAWWLSSTTNPLWIRHTYLVLVALVPVLVGFALVALRDLAGAPQRPVAGASGVVGVLAAGVLVVAPFAHVAARAGLPEDERGGLAAQRAVADAVRATGADRLQGYWGPTTEIAVLAGVRMVPLDEQPADPAVPRYLEQDLSTPQGREAAGAQRAALCGEVVVDAEDVLLCWPPG